MSSACSASSAGFARSRICRTKPSGSATRCSSPKAARSSCRSSRPGRSRPSSACRCLQRARARVPLHGSRGHSRRRGAAAPGRLHRHHRRSRLGLGLHPPHQRRPDAPPRLSNALREEVRLLVHAAEASTRSWAGRRARPRRSRREWLARAGKRWRPFLTVAAYQALRDNPERAAARRPAQGRRRRRVLPQGVAHPRRHRGRRRAALRRADAARGARRRRRAERRRPAHRRRLPPARRLQRSAAEQKAAMLAVAAEGQRELCRGQGAELVWARNPVAAHLAQVLDIFRQQDRARLRGRAPARRALRRRARRSRGRRCTTTAKRSASPTRSATTSTTSATTPPPTTTSASAPASSSPCLRERGKGDGEGHHGSPLERQSPNHRPTSPPSANGRRKAARTRRPAPARKLQGGGHPLPPRRGQPQPQGPPPPRDRQDFQRLEIKGWCNEFEEKNITDEAKAVAAKAVEHLEPAVVS